MRVAFRASGFPRVAGLAGRGRTPQPLCVCCSAGGMAGGQHISAAVTSAATAAQTLATAAAADAAAPSTSAAPIGTRLSDIPNARDLSEAFPSIRPGQSFDRRTSALQQLGCVLRAHMSLPYAWLLHLAAHTSIRPPFPSITVHHPPSSLQTLFFTSPPHTPLSPSGRVLRCANPSGASAADTSLLLDTLRIRDLVGGGGVGAIGYDDCGGLLVCRESVWRRASVRTRLRGQPRDECNACRSHWLCCICTSLIPLALLYVCHTKALPSDTQLSLHHGTIPLKFAKLPSLCVVAPPLCPCVSPPPRSTSVLARRWRTMRRTAPTRCWGGRPHGDTCAAGCSGARWAGGGSLVGPSG